MAFFRRSQEKVAARAAAADVRASIAVCSWDFGGFAPPVIGFPRFAELDLEEAR
jgi:hypothetical protein